MIVENVSGMACHKRGDKYLTGPEDPITITHWDGRKETITIQESRERGIYVGVAPGDSVHNHGERSLTINRLPDMAYGTAKANGWHDRKDEKLTAAHAVSQLAALAPVIQAVAKVAEAIRHPDTSNHRDATHALKCSIDLLYYGGLFGQAERQLDYTEEHGREVDGSKTQVQSWLVLIVTELAEAMEAVEKGDKANFAEELAADVPIRIGDAIGAINDMPGHFLGPIDMATEIEAKNDWNKQRGWRHGGKQA